MSVSAYQEKKKNIKAGKTEAGEERKRTIDYKEAVCYPSAVVQGAARQKIVCVRAVPGVTGGPLEDQQPF